MESTDINRNDIQSYVGRNLMLVAALSPVIGFQNLAHMAEDTQAMGSTPKAAAPKSGKIPEADYNRIIVLVHTIGAGLGGA